MPTFIFNKLIRDKLPAEYIRINHKAVYRKLSHPELLEALRNKVFEELNESSLDGSIEEFEKEIADTLQVIDDLITTKGASVKRINDFKREKFEKKGGFSEGNFVEQVTLTDDDEWVAYYRNEPDKYPEI